MMNFVRQVAGIKSVRVQATEEYAEGIGAENARRGGGFGGMSGGQDSEAFFELRGKKISNPHHYT